MSNKELKKIIEEKLKLGANRQDIFDEMSKEYGHEKTALLIAYIPKNERIQLTKKKHWLLFASVFLLSTLACYNFLSINSELKSTTYLVSKIGIIILFFGIITYQLYNRRIGGYMLSMFFAIKQFLESLKNVLDNMNVTMWLELIFVILSFSLAFHLLKVTFPNITPFGRIKKNTQGQYLLE